MTDPHAVVQIALGSLSDRLDEEWGLLSDTAPEGLDNDTHREARSLYHRVDTFVQIAMSLVRPPTTAQSQLAEPAWLATEAAKFAEEVERLGAADLEQLDISRLKELREELVFLFKNKGIELNPVAKEDLWSQLLQLRAADLFLPDLRRLSARLQQLGAFAVQFRGDAAESYLRLVARSYALEHQSELMVMAAASIEAALGDYLHEAGFWKADAPRPTFDEMLWLAKQRNVLSRTTLDGAHRIRIGRNDEVHKTPGITEVEPDQVMKYLCAVLSELHAWKKKRGLR